MIEPAIRLAIVVPCYNEARRLDIAAFETFLAAHREIEFCFVNDGSRDGTSAVLRSMAESNPTCRVIELEENRGKAEAVRQGVLHLQGQEFTHIGFWDADLATPLEAIAVFVETLARRPHVDVVIGSRIRRLGTDIRRKWYRHFLGRTFATVVSLMLRLPVYDTQCGAKVFSRNLYGEIFKEPMLTRWLFDVELLFRVLQSDYRAEHPECIYEIPLEKWGDKDASRLRLADFLKAPWELVRLYFHYGKRRRTWTSKKSTKHSLPTSETTGGSAPASCTSTKRSP